MFSNILLATDGSPASTRAAQLAVELARTCGARLTALYVIDPYPYLGIGESNPLGFQAYMSSAYEHAAQAHAKVAALCNKEGKAIELRWRRAEDVHASDGILQAAREEGADLIVVGSHGRTGIRRMLLGSIAAKVVSQSPVPVLVAREAHT
ncbi:universal stress protein [Caenimonas soli]|uniref:universal stress protein n=1 Tax=Caenimonas soli TaxID=2735555 RepID=UPI001551DAB3|nr:universal stress protein [Caenimonas soli]NPC56993.1 universal stress protein [Caenimonas soli]